MTSRHESATTDATADLAILSPQHQSQRTQILPGVAARAFPDYEALRQARFAACVVVIRSDDEPFNSQTLRALRRDPDYATSLIFVDGILPDADATISDGPLPEDADALTERIDDLRGRVSAMSRDDREPDHVLLEFMWLRPGFLLEPYADWRHPHRYRYPILEALDRADADPEGWLRRLDEQGMIERAGLKDRQRECDFCGSAHLSFIDRCPKCQSIDISEPQADGNCRCAQCDNVFVEGEVVARCVICNQTMAPDELRLHCLHAWRLSGLGRHAAQGRRAVQAPAVTDESEFASHEHFMSKLDWVLKIARQQRNLSFSLFAMRLENTGAMHQALGRARTAEVLDTFAQRVCEPLAEADLATRPEPELVWFLIADSDARALRKLHKVIQQLTDEIAAQEGIGPCWRTVDLTVTSRDAASQTTESLLKRLSGALTPEAAAEEIVAEAARRPPEPPRARQALDDEDPEDDDLENEEPVAAPKARRDEKSRPAATPPPPAAPAVVASRRPQRSPPAERGHRARRIAPTVD